MFRTKENKQSTKNSRFLITAFFIVFLTVLFSVFVISKFANADSNSDVCFSYEQTGVSSATIQVTGVSDYTAKSLDTSIATVYQEDDMITVTGNSGAVGVVDIQITYNSSSTYVVAVPIGYTVFSFDEDTLTVMPGTSSNYSIYGINATSKTTTEITPETIGTHKIYTNTSDAAINVEFTDASGNYVLTGSGNNMSITQAKKAYGSVYYLASCHLTSCITSPMSLKSKDSTIATAITALQGHSNSMTDNEINNDELTTATPSVYAENAVIKGKSDTNLLLNGTGNLTLNCKSKNAVKVGDAGNLTIENINLVVESVDHGISSDNTTTINSGSLIINSVTDALRADPDDEEIEQETCAGSILVNGGTFNIVTSSTGDGIQAYSTLVIAGGSFNIKTYGGSTTSIGDDTDSCKGLKCGTTLAITGGHFDLNCADDAVHADGDCTVTGGDFKIATGDDAFHAGNGDATPSEKLTLGTDGSDYPHVNITSCYEGLEGTQVIINSGTYSIVGTDDGINAALGNELESTACNIIVNGGSIYVNVDGDGFDANGSITINGGTCVVFGQTSTDGDNNPYDSETSFIINGGTVFGAGGNNPAANAPSGSSQGSIIYGGSGGGDKPGPGPQPPHFTSTNASDISANKTIDVKNESSQTVFSVKTPKTVNYVIYSDSNNPSSSWSISGDDTTPTWTTTKLNLPTCLTGSHSFSSEYVVWPTCIGAGTIKKTCSVCGATSYETVSALGHDLENDACKRCSYGDAGKISIDEAKFSTIASQTYSGSAFTPTPTVTLSGNVLTKDTDYTLSYSDNVNAGTATVYAKGIGSYTGSISTTFTINRAGIAYPEAVTGLTYTGNEQVGVPFGTGYNIIDNQKTNSGDFTAVATPDSNHMWSESSLTTSYNIDWSIAKAIASVSFGSDSVTVLIKGSQTTTPTIITDSSSFICTSSNTSLLTATYDNSTGVVTLTSPSSKTGTATVTLSFNEGTNYTAASATLNVEVATVGTATVPIAKEGLVYTGLQQAGVVASGTGYTLTGNTGTDAGSYTALATLSSGYTWTDGSTDVKQISWSIDMAEGFVKVGASSAVVPYGTIRDIAISTVGDTTDTITASSSAISVATASYDSSTSKITITPKALGTTTIKVTKAAGTNYKEASDSCTVYVTQGTGSTTLTKTSASIITGSFTTDIVTVVGDGATSVESSNTNVATATLSGKTLTIKGIAEGTATITVTTSETVNYSGSSAKCEVSVSDAVLEDGTYYFGSAASVRQVVDVSGGSKANGANVQLYQANESNAQKWKIVNQGNNVVKIINVGSGKALDVTGGTGKSGTNVWQYDSNNTDAQKWIPVKNTDNSITFTSCLNQKLVLDLSGGSTGNGTNVQIWTSNGSNAQKFMTYNLNPSIVSSGVEISEGYYAIQSAKNSNYFVDLDAGSSANGANIHLWSGKVNTNDNQCFKISKTSDGFYTIANCNTGKVLDVVSGCVLPSTNVWQYASNGTNAQKWNAIQVSSGVYTFQNVGTGLVLDVSGGSMSNGANIQGYINNDTSAQQWKLLDCTYTRGRLNSLATKYASAITDGTYTVSVAANGKFVLDVAAGSTKDGANVQLYSSNSTKAQKWKVTHDSNNYLVITNVGSGKVLDVAAGNASAGANVQQYTSNGSWAQRWIAVPSSASSTQFQLVSGLSDTLQLGTSGSSIGNGTNIQLVSTSTATRNIFCFTKATTNANEDDLIKINNTTEQLSAADAKKESL